MKDRELHTTPTLIVTNYSIRLNKGGKYLHTFTPESTSTVYQFLGNKEAVLVEGERYNIGYTVDNGLNWVNVSAISKSDIVDPIVSHYVARQYGEQQRDVETLKSNERVKHNATDGLYLGKKYAWRIYGEALARGTFDLYLSEINHPTIDCITDISRSIAYKDDGLAKAIDSLINSCIRVNNSSNRFSSPLIPSKKWFNIKGIQAITDRR
ncbi:hypothetical protein [Shewanella sp. S1-49-MNA-CIBAN-0167]|uniref:hypothetical protein n=1 Tax=Shewanella sp. S1-49-MNA-CIBAN-0167 TaxID=3140468 RepID=UPI00332027CD